MLHFRRLTWALRKVRLRVGDGLVLDVGSGGNPYPRSDVLLDRLTGAAHRCSDGMVIDRPAVFGDAARMPFKDKSFDFVIASHVLEHMAEPELFLSELQRVGKAGYIETPNAIFERLFPYHIHCLEIFSINGVLRIHKKEKPVQDSFLGGLDIFKTDPQWKSFFFQAPDMFHVRHHWQEKIDYTVQNPETSCRWIEAINSESEAGKVDDAVQSGGWRGYGLRMLNKWERYRRSRRLRNWELVSILACPDCRGSLQKQTDKVYCEACDTHYSCDPIPDFTHRL